MGSWGGLWSFLCLAGLLLPAAAAASQSPAKNKPAGAQPARVSASIPQAAAPKAVLAPAPARLAGELDSAYKRPASAQPEFSSPHKQPVEAAAMTPGAHVAAPVAASFAASVAPSVATPLAPAAPLEPSLSVPLDLEAVERLRVNSRVALVLDQDTQEVLFGKNDMAVMPIASLTKLMTALVIVDANLPMNHPVTITSADVDRLKNSGSRLPVGTRMTRGEALHLALMSSENRAAHALGRTFPGGMDQFVRRMNQKAQALGMRNTRFVEPTGLSPSNASTARDLAVLAAETARHPIIRNLTTSAGYDLTLNNKRVVQYRNSNRLTRRPDWDIGVQKTGFIREAGRCLVMQVTVSGRPLIMVLLDANNSTQRIQDAERVRSWVEAALPQNFEGPSDLMDLLDDAMQGEGFEAEGG
jgi:serine-type D-Ala-D-Ala endopeptidase (penicillin-binding protein 7)